MVGIGPKSPLRPTHGAASCAGNYTVRLLLAPLLSCFKHCTFILCCSCMYDTDVTSSVSWMALTHKPSKCSSVLVQDKNSFNMHGHVLAARQPLHMLQGRLVSSRGTNTATTMGAESR